MSGDTHAVSSAHALLSAMIDTLMVKGNPGRLDPMKVVWRRCVDMNDGALRDIGELLARLKEPEPPKGLQDAGQLWQMGHYMAAYSP